MIENGVNALELIESEPVNSGTFTKAVAILQANFGTEYSPEKVALLFDLIREEKWSEERFARTFLWFVKNKPFPSWTIADWFSFQVKLYPYEWFMAQCRPGVDVRKDMDIYELPDGTVAYRWKDGTELPFKKFVAKGTPKSNYCHDCGQDHTEEKCPKCGV